MLKVLFPVFIAFLVTAILLLFNQKDVSEYNEIIFEAICEDKSLPRAPPVELNTCTVTTLSKKSFVTNKVNGVYKKGDKITVIESKNIFTGTTSYKIK